MAEKRFRYEGAKVFDGDKLLCYTLSIWVEQLVDLLNKLNDECEFLEIENESLEDGATRYAELYHKSLKENEQLKQFKEDVFNKIDMHLHMLPTARDNEFNEDNGDPSLYSGAIYMLETLKEELSE